MGSLSAYPDTFDKCYFIESCHGATEEEKEIHTQKWKMVSVCGLLHEDGRMQSNFDFINPMDRDCIPSAKSEARHEALAGLLTGDRSRS